MNPTQSTNHHRPVYRRTLTCGMFAIVASLTHTALAEDCDLWHAFGGGIGDAGFNPVVRSVASYNGDLIAGGQFAEADGQPVNRIVRWDGRSWQQMRSGVDGGSAFPTVHAMTIYNGELIIGGIFSHSGNFQTQLNNIARWDEGSQSWQPLGVGVNDGIFALEVYNGDLYAGGDFTMAGGQSANYIARWDGSQWHALGTGISGANPPWVMSLEVYND
jgi:hypothetical protein